MKKLIFLLSLVAISAFVGAMDYEERDPMKLMEYVKSLDAYVKSLDATEVAPNLVSVGFGSKPESEWIDVDVDLRNQRIPKSFSLKFAQRPIWMPCKGFNDKDGLNEDEIGVLYEYITKYFRKHKSSIEKAKKIGMPFYTRFYYDEKGKIEKQYIKVNGLFRFNADSESGVGADFYRKVLNAVEMKTVLEHLYGCVKEFNKEVKKVKKGSREYYDISPAAFQKKDDCIKFVYSIVSQFSDEHYEKEYSEFKKMLQDEIVASRNSVKTLLPALIDRFEEGSKNFQEALKVAAQEDRPMHSQEKELVIKCQKTASHYYNALVACNSKTEQHDQEQCMKDLVASFAK